jgi:tripartite-type tricarboxylate transporter receptor subunit TctC
MTKMFPRAVAAAMLAVAAPWLSLGTASPAAAQGRAYPSQPIRVIVPFSAGTSDTVARLVGQKMSESMGQPLVVESRPGAGGNIGSEACAQAKPDGYTICLGTISSHAINPSIFVKMPYDNMKDFAPITQLAAQPNALAVTNDLPAKNIAELITLLKANPGKYNYGSSGVGTSIHLAGALFSQLTGTEMEHVPYRGSGQIMTALLTGELPLAFDNFSSAWPFGKEGKIRILGVTSLTRNPAAPDIPAIAETVPGFESLSWHGFFAPAATPPDIVARLNKEAVAALKSDTVSARFRELGITPIGNTSDEFRAFIASETKRWGDVARNAKIQVD